MSAVLATAATAAIAMTGASISAASAYWLNSRLLAGLLLAVTVLAAWQCWQSMTAPPATRSPLLWTRFHRPHCRLRQRHQPFWRRLPRAPLVRR